MLPWLYKKDHLLLAWLVCPALNVGPFFLRAGCCSLREIFLPGGSHGAAAVIG